MISNSPLNIVSSITKDESVRYKKPSRNTKAK